MIDKTQIQLTKTLLEQSRTAVIQTHQAWSLVMKSQRTLVDSMRNAGILYMHAADQFNKLMQFHSAQSTAAFEYMNNMSKEYLKLLPRQKK